MLPPIFFPFFLYLGPEWTVASSSRLILLPFLLRYSPTLSSPPPLRVTFTNAFSVFGFPLVLPLLWSCPFVLSRSQGRRSGPCFFSVPGRDPLLFPYLLSFYLGTSLVLPRSQVARKLSFRKPPPPTLRPMQSPSLPSYGRPILLPPAKSDVVTNLSMLNAVN